MTTNIKRDAEVKNISSISCNVQVQSQQRHLASTVGLEAVAIVAGVLRLGSRWKFEGGFKTDDYIMLAVLVCIPRPMPGNDIDRLM